MQMDRDNIEDINKNDLLEENDIEVTNFIFENFIVLINYKMYLKSDLKSKGIEFVDENYNLLTRANMQEFYDMLSLEEKTECYKTLDDFIEEGLSGNGSLSRLKF